MELYEFHRRLRMIELAKGTFYRVPLEPYIVGNETIFMPAGFQEVSYSCVWHDGNEMVMSVPPDTKVPTELNEYRLSVQCGNLKEIAEETDLQAAAKCAEFDGGYLDELVPAIVDGKLSDSLHSSYAHTVIQFSDTFTYTQNPITGAQNTGQGTFTWQDITESNYIRVDGTRATNNNAGGTVRTAFARGPAVSFVDYSVEADIVANRGAGSSSACYPGVIGRAQAGNAQRQRVRVYSVAGSNTFIQWHEMSNSTTGVSLVNYDTGSTGTTFKIRMQMVGTNGVMWVNEVSRGTPTLSSMPAGNAGIYVGMGASGGTSYPGYIDNFVVYVPVVPTTPTNFTASFLAYKTKVALSWTASTGDGTVTYRIVRSLATNNDPAQATTIISGLNVDVTTWDDTTAEEQISYRYWIRAESEYGNSAWSTSAVGAAGLTACPEQWAYCGETLTLDSAGNSKTAELKTVVLLDDPPELENRQLCRPVVRRVVDRACKLTQVTAHYAETIDDGAIIITVYLLTRERLVQGGDPLLAAGDVILASVEYSNALDPDDAALTVVVAAEPII